MNVRMLLGLCGALAAHAAHVDKVFFIGQGSTGTRTLSEMMRARGYKTVHNICPDARTPWNHPVLHHDKHHRCLVENQAFLDHGDLLDLNWLAAEYHNARFVLNVRPLLNWVVSRVDHAANKRLELGCSPYGTKRTCPKLQHMPDNSNITVAHWIKRVAAMQSKALRMFSTSWSLRQRFVVIGLETMKPCDVDKLLDWVLRHDYSNARTTPHLIHNAAELPPGGRAHCSRAAASTHTGVVSHPPRTTRRIHSLLRAFGCGQSMWNDVMYMRCAAKIPRSMLH